MALVLHAIILKKPIFNSKDDAFIYAREHYPGEHIKGFVRETSTSYRVRVIPKGHFKKETFISKVINPYTTLIFGKLK